MPVARRAVPTVPVDRLDAFNDVSEAPEPLKAVALMVPETLKVPVDGLKLSFELATYSVETVPVVTSTNVR